MGTAVTLTSFSLLRAEPLTDFDDDCGVAVKLDFLLRAPSQFTFDEGGSSPNRAFDSDAEVPPRLDGDCDDAHGASATVCLARKESPQDVDTDCEDTLEIELVLILPVMGIPLINEELR
jgi:hypothetical protein